MSSFPALSGDQIRAKFLQFYAERGHRVLPSASLVPEDPTVLLTIAGMLPFKPIFLGQQVAEFPRVTTAQKCIRTNDIENVGKTARHHTFFEMLGNFSFGDYFKAEAIAWGWELVTQVYQLPPAQLVVSVYHSDDQAFEIWRDQIGIPSHRIQRLGDDNFWASGPTGPCGPCSEIYFDFKPELGDQEIDLEDDTRFLEIYNLVFMELNRDREGNLTPLAKQNIDTGLGLERMAQVLQRVPNNYETDLILPIVEAAAAIAGLDYAQASEDAKTALKVIGDHVRAVVHMISDGVVASNVGRGYVLRRLLRRVVRHGRTLGINGGFIWSIAEVAIKLAQGSYPQVGDRAEQIREELEKEEQRFLQTLERGESLLAEILATALQEDRQEVKGIDAFTLFDTYGFPVELTEEIAAEQGLTVDRAGFDLAMAAQKQRSKAAHSEVDLLSQASWGELAEELGETEFVGYHILETEATVQVVIPRPQGCLILLDRTPFYGESGGQVGDQGVLICGETEFAVVDVQKEQGLVVHYLETGGEGLQVGDRLIARVLFSSRRRTQAHHSATHLLQAALQKLVDPGISQAGSLVDRDRLRFDFHLNRAVTPTELDAVEAQINQWILEGHGAKVAVMPIAAAKAQGAIAMFGEKYGAQVRVVDFPGVSIELCGGTHVQNTAEIGLFKIVAESGVAAGIRRIEAVAGQAVRDYLQVRDQITKELSDRFKVKPEEILERVHSLQQELKATQKQMESLKQAIALNQAAKLLDQQVEQVGRFQILVAELPELDADGLKAAAEMLINKLTDGVVVLGSAPQPDRVNLVAACSGAVNQQGIQAGKLIGAIAKITGGGGGGRANFAQAGGKDASKLSAALAQAHLELHQKLEAK